MALTDYITGLSEHLRAYSGDLHPTAQRVPVIERTTALLEDFQALLESLAEITEDAPRKIHTDEVRSRVWEALDLDGAS
jgi:hypothetical protein